jgi:hypothetical protein
MFVMMINCGGSGTSVSLGRGTSEPATTKARPRQGVVAVAGDLPTRRAGAQQLM